MLKPKPATCIAFCWRRAPKPLALSRPYQRAFKDAVKDDVNTAHRRAHRMGRPARIAVDSELQAFVAARFDTLTFAQIAKEVADNFPPERRVSLSAIHRWWQKTRSN